MNLRTKDTNSVIAKKYDEAVLEDEYVFDIKRIEKYYKPDEVEYFYDSEMTAVVVAVVKDCGCVAIMAYNFNDRANFKVYKMLRIAYNCFKSFEFICLLENVLSIKWCLRFGKKNSMKVTYNSDEELIKFTKEEH